VRACCLRRRRRSSRPEGVATHAACDGARENAKKYGFKIVYDKTYPPGTTDFSPIVRALQAANADLVVVCSNPLSSVGIVLSANELGLPPKMFGGSMVGLQATVIKDRLKSKLNGIVNYETFIPQKGNLVRNGRPRTYIRNRL
jgi:branched-chain amino acid transport system substrate-binding protein